MKELSRKLEMILSKEIKPVLTTLLLIMVLGCSSVKNNNLDRLIVKIQDVYNQDSLEYGEIIYKSPIMDTLRLGEKDKRYLWLHFGIYDKLQDIRELEGKTTESYRAINDSVIPFKSKYHKKGTYFFEGYIEETILLHNYYKSGDTRKISNLIKISKKIRVSDK